MTFFGTSTADIYKKRALKQALLPFLEDTSWRWNLITANTTYIKQIMFI